MLIDGKEVRRMAITVLAKGRRLYVITFRDGTRESRETLPKECSVIPKPKRKIPLINVGIGHG